MRRGGVRCRGGAESDGDGHDDADGDSRDDADGWRCCVLTEGHVILSLNPRHHRLSSRLSHAPVLQMRKAGL